jgi:hypothetical protein
VSVLRTYVRGFAHLSLCTLRGSHALGTIEERPIANYRFSRNTQHRFTAMRKHSRESAVQFSPIVGGAANAARFTVNISADVARQLRQIAFDHRVSESSIIEIALRQLLRHVNPAALGSFLRQNGACLRRRA